VVIGFDAEILVERRLADLDLAEIDRAGSEVEACADELVGADDLGVGPRRIFRRDAERPNTSGTTPSGSSDVPCAVDRIGRAVRPRRAADLAAEARRLRRRNQRRDQQLADHADAAGQQAAGNACLS
jgi:hypothetical protein